MTTHKIRLGVIGANPNVGWAPRAHLPALAASPDVELTAVCTTRPESAAASAQKYGARMAFHDYRALLACPDIDAVAVVLRVPSHYEPTRAAIEAGKHVFTEWPLGKTTAEAEELTALAHLEPLSIPPYHRFVPDTMPQGAPYNVGQLYALFAKAIRTGDVSPSYATFETAVGLHRLIDAISASSAQGQQVRVPVSATAGRHGTYAQA